MNSASAESLASKVRRANSFFRDGKYQDALKKYQEAQVEAPADERVMFNLGNAQYKLNESERALSEYLQAAQTEDPKLRAQSNYNAGNALYRMGKLEEAVQQYLKALEDNPEDEDAKYNMEFVRREIRRRMEQQQQREQDQEQQSRSQENKKQENSSNQQDQQNENEQQQKQEKQQNENQQEQQSSPQGSPESQDAESRAGEQASTAAVAEAMSKENVERYLEAIEAESAQNMKEFLRRRYHGEVVANPEDW